MFDVEDAHWWYASLHRLIRDVVAGERAGKGPLEIFDAGCGTGRLCQLLSEFGAVSGCDMSRLAVDRCAERGLPDISLLDLNDGDVGRSRYDVVTSIDVLYHQWVKDEAAVLRKLGDALRPGGVLIFQSPAFRFLRSRHDAAVLTGRRYTKKQVRRLVEEAGLAVETITYRVFFLFPLIAAYRFAQKPFVGRRGAAVVSDVAMPPLLINRMLLKVHLWENALLKRRSLPFGTSVFAVARKPLRR